jgi:hypothetical protein
MWEVLCSRDDLPGWLPGRALEYLVLRAFQLEGAEVTWRAMREGLQRKLRHAIEQGFADFNLTRDGEIS